MAKDWSHGLFGCFDDCGTCLVTHFCGCYTAGKNAEAVGDSCVLCGLATFVPLANIFFMAQIRSKIREQRESRVRSSMISSQLAVVPFVCWCNPLKKWLKEGQAPCLSLAHRQAVSQDKGTSCAVKIFSTVSTVAEHFEES